MHESSRVKVSGPHIVSEIIDGEAIIIDLNTGSYYSLQDAGAEIWAGVQDSLRVSEIVGRLQSRYEAARDTIRNATTDLLEQLESEALITSNDARSDDRGAAPDPLLDPHERTPFSPPELHTYTDMQQLLLVDPIHEVDASGWPERPHDRAESDG